MLLLQNVSKEYHLDEDIVFKALQNINIEIEEGEFASIMGPSGSGKSTLMHLIGLLDKPSRGKIVIEGKDVSLLNDDQLSTLRNEFVGFIFQQFNLVNKLNVMENILLPFVYARKKLDYNPEKHAVYLMERFGIINKKNTYPNKLSGGQQQRVAIARALIMKPRLVLADEPTVNLDSKTGQEILNLLKELNKEKITIVIVTHDKNVAAITRKQIKIYDGKLV